MKMEGGSKISSTKKESPFPQNVADDWHSCAECWVNY
jgi:hypothetical protein